MKKLTDREFATLVRCGKTLAKRKYYTEDIRTANAIRLIILLAKKYANK